MKTWNLFLVGFICLDSVKIFLHSQFSAWPKRKVWCVKAFQMIYNTRRMGCTCSYCSSLYEWKLYAHTTQIDKYILFSYPRQTGLDDDGDELMIMPKCPLKNLKILYYLITSVGIPLVWHIFFSPSQIKESELFKV